MLSQVILTDQFRIALICNKFCFVHLLQVAVSCATSSAGCPEKARSDFDEEVRDDLVLRLAVRVDVPIIDKASLIEGLGQVSLGDPKGSHLLEIDTGNSICQLTC